MTSPKINGVHFVGSVPIPTEEDCFRTICSALPGRISRIPDGEVGERDYFVKWQLNKFRGETRVIHPTHHPGNPTTYSDDEAEEIVRALGDLETGYDDYALSSYATFKKLKAEGVIPREVRFQVCLPTPINVLFGIHPSLRSKMEPVYERALQRSLKRIQDNIPHGELAIQLDIPIEVGILDGADFYGIEKMKPWFEPILEGILERIGRMTEAVAQDVELGFHLCYGEKIQDCTYVHDG